MLRPEFYFSCRLPDDLVRKWCSDGKKHLIRGIGLKKN